MSRSNSWWSIPERASLLGWDDLDAGVVVLDEVFYVFDEDGLAGAGGAFGVSSGSPSNPVRRYSFMASDLVTAPAPMRRRQVYYRRAIRNWVSRD